MNARPRVVLAPPRPPPPLPSKELKFNMEGGELTSARYVLAKAGVELPEALNQAGAEYLLM